MVSQPDGRTKPLSCRVSETSVSILLDISLERYNSKSFSHIIFFQGAKCIGISEYNGDLFNENGIDILALEDYKLKNGGSIVGFDGARVWDAEAEGPLIEAECDILGVCAKEKV